MSKTDEQKAQDQIALDYHASPTPGKISLQATKALATQRDLALAYSPGVAVPCLEIAKDPLAAYDYTSKGNIVAVISNGTAVLGLGNIGAQASKPVMEGKSVLFKKFANIDSFDVEVNETDVDKLVEIIAALEPTYGGINLEDFKAPECFELERRLKERMNIPVFHDDQHGTAIIVAAAFKNWLKLSGRDVNKITMVVSGAGASATACINLLLHAGLKKENILVCDSKGVIYKGREDESKMAPEKAAFLNETDARTLDDAIENTDIFLGLSCAGVLNSEMVAKMADAPLIMALANPTPEIMPDETRKGKPDAVICTGRSDFPNQVNNVLGFPFLFRGALDVGASAINEEMKLAAVEAIAALARKEADAEVIAVYSGENLTFGSEYLIPKPFDPRLIIDIPMAVAKAAMDSGVARRPIKDWTAYENQLKQFCNRSLMIMHPIFERAKKDPKRITYCEGEEDKVLQATQIVVDEALAKPILVGRKDVINRKIKILGLRIKADEDFEVVDPTSDKRYTDYWQTYHTIMQRNGITPDDAKNTLRINNTVIGSLMVYKDDSDGVICGMQGHYHTHLKDLLDIIGLMPGVETPAALAPLVLQDSTCFFCDTQVNENPSAEQITEMTLMAVREIRRFGINPRVALLSRSNFGSVKDAASQKMRAAYEEIRRRDPGLEIDGEMQADTALIDSIRQRLMPNSSLTGPANLFIMPNADSANIAFNMVKSYQDGISVGPLLVGTARPAHIITPATTIRALVNITSLATVEAQVFERELNGGTQSRFIKSVSAA
ncbi:MAG: NADP-dependent malic enzyme [Alphaproteobacteria bacterium]